MRVAIVGAGPSGLALAILLRRAGLAAEVDVYEQNPPDATFGFGVVFSASALEFLRADDPQTHAAITPHLESWSDIHVVLRGERIVIDGVGFTAIGRLHLLRILQDEARRHGVCLQYGRAIADLAELPPADLIVGADGVNSLVRHSEPAFGAELQHLENRFAWFGTTCPFEALTQTFVDSPDGFFNAHHYRYAPGMSTFIVECDAATFARNRFDARDEEDTRALLQEVFADALRGHALISNKSVWRRFPVLSNRRWSVGNKVLLGDALHTAHFSIGSGTRLALEDAIALTRALAAHRGDVPAALAAYEAARRPVLELLVGAASRSAQWYERFPDHMRLPSYDFVMSYITRSGRVDPERLRQQSPRFMSAYDRRRSAAS